MPTPHSWLWPSSSRKLRRTLPAAAGGLVFGWLYARTKRVMPLVIAHTLLDVVAFVGYALLKDHLPWL